MNKHQLKPYQTAQIHYFHHTAATHGRYPESSRKIINLSQANKTKQRIQSWPGYQSTPMHSLDTFAAAAELGKIWYKDESGRFNLGSFKALGGAYAIEQLLMRELSKRHNKNISYTELRHGEHQQFCSALTVTTATDGNHGRSVAWGAQRYGCRCIIYIHAGVSVGREQMLKKYAAEVVRVAGNYDDSVHAAAQAAMDHGWFVVSDTSYPGYTDVPRDVMSGYTVMCAEIIDQLGQTPAPTHVFIQGGVGGLAAAVIGYFWAYYQQARPRFIIVEPTLADCLYQTAKAGRPITVEGDLNTMMAGLACGEISLLAWEILQQGADDFVTIDDATIPHCMRLLHAHDIEAGESAVPGLASALISALQPATREALGLSSDSVVLVFGTEGATDPKIYQQIIAD